MHWSISLLRLAVAFTWRSKPPDRPQRTWSRVDWLSDARAAAVEPKSFAARSFPDFETTRSYHHECTHRSHRCQRPPADGVGQRRLRGNRHHLANRRRVAGRSVRAALG